MAAVLSCKSKVISSSSSLFSLFLPAVDLFLPLDLFPLTPISLLQRQHPGLAHFSIPREEMVEILGLHHGTDFGLGLFSFAVEGLGFSVGGSDEEGERDVGVEIRGGQ